MLIKKLYVLQCFTSPLISNALEKLNVSYCFKIPFDFNYFMDIIKRVFSDETKINETHVNETGKNSKS